MYLFSIFPTIHFCWGTGFSTAALRAALRKGL
jgi:hypothetical protein